MLSSAVVISIICSFFSSGFALITYAITSLGDAISFQVFFNAFQIFGLIPIQPLSQIIAQYSIFGWPCSMIQTVYIRQFIDWKLACFMGIVSGFSTFLGLGLLMKYQGIWLKRGMGLLILSTWIITKMLPKIKSYCSTEQHQSLQQINDRSRKSYSSIKSIDSVRSFVEPYPDDGNLWKPDSVKSFIGLLCACFGLGFSHGLFGIGGPPLMIWVLWTNINRNQLRASLSCASCFCIHPVTSYYLVVYQKQLHFRTEWITYLCIFIGGMFGITMGNMLAKRVNQERFNEIVQGLLMAGALILCLSGFTFGYIAIPCAVSFVGLLYVGCICYNKHLQQNDTKKLIMNSV